MQSRLETFALELYQLERIHGFRLLGIDNGARELYLVTEDGEFLYVDKVE